MTNESRGDQFSMNVSEVDGQLQNVWKCFFYHLTLLLLLWCSTNPDENNDKRNFKFWRAVIKWFNFWHCIRVAAKLSVVYWTKITIRNYVNPQNTNLNEHVWHNLCLKQGMRKLWADPMLPFFLPRKADHMRVKRDRGETILGGFDSRPTESLFLQKQHGNSCMIWDT